MDVLQHSAVCIRHLPRMSEVLCWIDSPRVTSIAMSTASFVFPPEYCLICFVFPLIVDLLLSLFVANLLANFEEADKGGHYTLSLDEMLTFPCGTSWNKPF